MIRHSDTVRDLNDNVYVNLKLFNSKNNPRNIECSILQESGSDILSNPSEYFFSIIRFEIPSFSTPIFVFQTQDGQADSNLGIYSVTLENAAGSSRSYLQWVRRSGKNTPGVDADSNQIYDDYYFVYSQHQFLNLVNTAFSTAFAGLTGAPVDCEAPQLIYNPTTALFSIVVQQRYYDLLDSGIADPIKIWMNKDLFALFYSFFQQTNLVDSTPTADGRDNQVLIHGHVDNYWNPTNVASVDPPEYLKVEQDYVTANTWSSGLKVIIMSDTIPSLYEQTPVNITENEQGQVGYKTILTDFNPLNQQFSGFRGIYEYNPQPQYRLVDLISNQPLSKISLRVLLEDSHNNLYPLYLGKNQSCQLKLGFFRKSLYSNDPHEIQ